MATPTTQDTGKFRTNTKDQYYTRASIAKSSVETVLRLFPRAVSYQWVEPSAGNGVFLKALPDGMDKIGIDLDPKSDGIQKGDFLDWVPIRLEKPRIFFGNPPFGRQGSLAKAFIKHSAEFADIIAFILPRSFVKPSMSRAFPLNFHCSYSKELEKNSFEVNGKEYDVPCIFQIWEKKALPRQIEPPTKEAGFEYVKHGEAFHIAFKRAGGLAGKCYRATPTSTADFNPQYHYYLKLEDQYVPHIQKILDTVNAHVFPSNTVGPRSLSKSEANEVLNKILDSLI
jgi:hypothetical protein